jgi:hypothetical protein
MLASDEEKDTQMNILKSVAVAALSVAMLALAQAAPATLQQDIANFEMLNHQCFYGPPDQPEEDMNKACAAVDVLVKKLNAQGYCIYGHGVVGRSSKDKKHCYEIKGGK